jgi:foldase protein PrsA
VVVVALAAGLVGCGADPKSPTDVRVGDARIGMAVVEHWSRAMARGAGVGGVYAGQPGTLRQRALAFLISAEWLRGEAAAQGVTPSDGAVEHALDDRKEANGAPEFQAALRASGQTVEDVKLEIEAGMASAAIRRKVLSRSPAVAEGEVADYYKSRPRLFRVPQKRSAELIENLASPAAANALVKRIGTGLRFSKKALHEELTPTRVGERLEPDIERVTKAIFAAPVGVASRPMRLNGRWSVFVVREITPAGLEPLAKVRAAIAARLAVRHRAATLTAFADAYRARWTAKTSCRPGYVVQGCAQYTGPVRPQPDPFPGE